MSNALAIAAATATLKRILEQGIAHDPDDTEMNDAVVTILPLDKARGNNTANQLNVFLYQIQRNAAWVNTGPPQQVSRAGETGFLAPLPLNLWYLLTAFGRNDDSDNSAQPFGHHVLGKAMSILHDHPVLSAEDIQAATHSILPASDLDRQIERIRITQQPLSVEEIYRLWTGFRDFRTACPRHMRWRLRLSKASGRPERRCQCSDVVQKTGATAPWPRRHRCSMKRCHPPRLPPPVWAMTSPLTASN